MRNCLLCLIALFVWCAPAFCVETISPEQPQKTVLFAILARNKAHVLPWYLQCLDSLDYDKSLITVYINTNNNEDDTLAILEAWAAKNKALYKDILFESHTVKELPSSNPHDWKPVRFKVLGEIRNKSMRKAKECGCDYYFVVDCDNFIKPCTLKELVKRDKPIIAPMLRAIPDPNDMYCNFFCDVSENGYYKAHPDYSEILYRHKVGTLKVPVVHCTYLIKSECIDKLTYVDNTDDYEFVIFSRSAREHDVGQYICNEHDFGVLLHPPDTLTLQEESALIRDYLVKTPLKPAA
jgi:hypothetical protein